MSTQGNWIYEIGSATPGSGGGGGTNIPPVPPVVIDAANVTVTLRNNDLCEVDIPYTVPGATAANFAGVAVYVEDPDVSTGGGTPMDGTAHLDGANQVSGQWAYLRDNDAQASPTPVWIPVDTVERPVRIYLVSFGPHTLPQLARATDTNPSPSVVATIPAGALTYISGMENAWLITNPSVTVNPKYAQNPPKYSLTFQYTPPTPEEEAHRPPGIGHFGGVEIWYDLADGSRIDAGLQKYIQNKAGSTKWTSLDRSVTDPVVTRVWFVSTDDGYRQNTIVAGVTPYVDVTIDVTAAKAPDVSGLVIVTPPGITTDPNIDGSYDARIPFAWNLPASTANYDGLWLYLVKVTGGVAGHQTPFPQPMPGNAVQFNKHDTGATVFVSKIPSVAESWTVAAISVDVATGVLADDPAAYGQASFHSPTVTFTIGPKGSGALGGEWAPLVTPPTAGAVLPVEQTNPDGVRVVQYQLSGLTTVSPSDPNFKSYGGLTIAMVTNDDVTNAVYWDVPTTGGTPPTSFTTPWMTLPGAPGVAVPLTFYLVSRDPQGNRNSVLPGTTPVIPYNYTPTQGHIIPARSGWFDPSQFAWVDTAGGLQAQTLSSQVVQVANHIVIGGGPNTFGGSQNGQLAINDKDGNLIGWAGAQTAGAGGGAGLFGAWFKQLWIGGTKPLDAPIFVDNNGVIEVGGIAAAQGTSYPYVSIRDETGMERGRIGAKINVASPDGAHDATGGGNGPISSGAWFTQFAAGGADISKWNFLIVPDGTSLGSSIQIRNVASFTIDYLAQQSTPPYSKAYRLSMGSSLWAGITTGTNWQFPGIAIQQWPSQAGQGTLTRYGSLFVSRGLVLRGPQSGNPIIASLVQYNGDSSGSDDTYPAFFGELAMYSPTNPAVRSVYLASGQGGPSATDAGAQFSLTDKNGSVTFNVSTAGDVTQRGGLTVSGYGQVIDATGHWTGVPIPGSGGSGVSSINSLTGAITLAAGTNITITPSGNTLTFAATGSGGGQPQTPWAQNIAGAGFSLSGALNISATGTITATGGFSGGAFTGAGVNVGSYRIGGGSLNVGSGPINCGAIGAMGAISAASIDVGSGQIKGGSLWFGSSNIITSAGVYQGAQVASSGDVKGATLSVNAFAPVVNASGAFVGAGVNVGAYGIGGGSLSAGSGPITGGSLSVSGDIHGASLTFGQTVINTGGVFVGAQVASPGDVKGATLSVTNFPGVVNSNGAFVGAGVNCPAYGIGGGSLSAGSGPISGGSLGVSGAISGASLNVGSGDIHGGTLTFGSLVINSGGVFVGAQVASPGDVKGATLSVNNFAPVVNSSGVFVGPSVNVGGSVRADGGFQTQTYVGYSTAIQVTATNGQQVTLKFANGLLYAATIP